MPSTDSSSQSWDAGRDRWQTAQNGPAAMGDGAEVTWISEP